MKIRLSPSATPSAAFDSQERRLVSPAYKTYTTLAATERKMAECTSLMAKIAIPRQRNRED
jgi:hypothetical protein